MSSFLSSIAAVVPAAGVGKRMQANCPKQYLTINNKAILTHTVERLLSFQAITKVVIVISEGDEYFADTGLQHYDNVVTAIGGQERVDSVLSGLKALSPQEYDWVMVHDAARPCVDINDITRLVNTCQKTGQGGLLATPVSDTMKRANDQQSVQQTVDRSELWHAFTPQMYRLPQLINAIDTALEKKLSITDESSAIEAAGLVSHLVEGRSDNIKITRPDDLALAAFILQQQEGVSCV